MYGIEWSLIGEKWFHLAVQYSLAIAGAIIFGSILLSPKLSISTERLE